MTKDELKKLEEQGWWFNKFEWTHPHDNKVTYELQFKSPRMLNTCFFWEAEDWEDVDLDKLLENERKSVAWRFINEASHAVISKYNADNLAKNIPLFTEEKDFEVEINIQAKQSGNHIETEYKIVNKNKVEK